MANPWDEFKPVESAGPARTPGGGVILSDPLQANQEARAERSDARAAAADARAAEAAARERIKFGMEVDPTKGKPTEAQGKAAVLLSRITGGFADIGDVTKRNAAAQEPGAIESVRGGLSPTGLGGILTRNLADADRRIVYDAQVDILDALLTLGTGAAYNREQLEGQLTSYFPQYGDTPAEIAVKNRRLRRQIEAAKLQAGPLADDLEKAIAPYFPQTDADDAASADAANLEAATGDTYSTGDDLEIAAGAQEIWNRGGSIADINAYFQSKGRPPLSPEDAAKIAPGKPAVFAPSKSGKASDFQKGVGAITENPVGANVAGYAAGAANALTAGTMDELAALAGGDPQAIEMGKAFLREKAPIGSFVGEMTGGTLAMSPVGAAMRAVPALGKGAALAGDLLYGGAYGAGETNDNRLGGALLGAGAAGAGGALARRFFPEGGAGDAPGASTPESGPTPSPDLPVPAAPATSSALQTVPQAVEPQDLGRLISTASGSGKRSTIARTKLAELAAVNPEAKAAAQRLGIEVPADVFADNQQIREAIGITRAVAGSDASAAWRESMTRALDQADNVMKEFDATFVEGTVSPGVVSEGVKARLMGESSALERQASSLYRKVDESIPKETPIQLTNVFETLSDIAAEVGADGMSAPEKRLLGAIQSGEAGSGDITYGRLIREKDLIGKAMARKESPYGSMDEASLKRLYAALAQDQLDNVARIGGEPLRKELRAANLLWAKRAGLNKRIVSAFGEDFAGSIADKMRLAITNGAKGDAGEFTRLMKMVPDDLKREVAATALASVTRAGRSAEPGFGFAEFTKIYPQLRANPPVYKQIVDALGKDSADRLRDLYTVSKRITQARADVPTTGKANQALLQGMKAEGLVKMVMSSAAGKRAATGVAGMVPGGGFVAPDIVEFLAAKKDVRDAAGKLFTSEEFQTLLSDSAKRADVPERAISRVATSKPFAQFADKIGVPKSLKDRANWIRSALTVSSTSMTPRGEETRGEGPVIQVGAPQ